MERTPDDPRETVVNRFLRAYLEDRDDDRIVELSAYQARFPGHDELIAREYAALRRDDVGDDHLRSIGSYRVLRELGRGGQGTVFLAQHERLPRLAAVKVLRGVDAYTKERRLRFVREAELASRLDHPSICTVYEADEADGVTYLAMRYVDGPNLADWIAERRATGRHDLGRALEVVEQVARAVHAAHEIGIVHRDVKPANVLLDGERPVLTDFGTARDLDAETLTFSGDVVGTPAYMAPEQIRGNAHQFGWTIDIYALGVTLYECVTLELPFRGSNLDSLYRQILEGDTPDPRDHVPSIGRDLVAVLQRALEKTPGRRYVTAAAFADDLARLRRGEPVSVQPIGPISRLVRRARRRPVQATLVALVLLASVTAAGLFASRSVLAAAFEVEASNVVHLAAFQRLDDLAVEADELWPPVSSMTPRYEDWLERADEVVDGLDEMQGGRPGHREQLARLEARALPRSPEQIAADREAHPLYSEYRRRSARVASMKRALEVVGGAREPATYELGDDEDLSRSTTALQMIVFEMIWYSPGEEPRALALAQFLLGRAENDGQRAEALLLAARAHAALGSCDEALIACDRALELAPAATRMRLESEVEGVRTQVTELVDGRFALRLAQHEAELAPIAAAVEGHRVWEFETTEDRWWHAQLVELVQRIERFADPRDGLVDGISPEHGWGVRRRLELVEQVHASSRGSPAARAAWGDARVGIAASELYGGLEIAPIEGLLPLGADAVSGLWEFAELSSGVAPTRDEDGRLVVDDGSAVVLVLLPGGATTMGAQARDRDGPNFARQAEGDEGPVHVLELSPFFLSKFELTQSQWLRWTGAVPSSAPFLDWKPGWGRGAGSGRNPVESVSWSEADRVLGRFGLRLPTEAEWEYAVRAGSPTSWATGVEPDSLEGHANLADDYGARVDAELAPQAVRWDDGWARHAPVGLFAPNPFGLHDLQGNVREWCVDGYQSVYARVLLEESLVDPVFLPERSSSRVVRGGSYRTGVRQARSAYRETGDDELGYEDVGIRPARSLE